MVIHETQDTRKPFGPRMREQREALEYGLRIFAKQLGLSPTDLSKIERGEELPTFCMAFAAGQLLEREACAKIAEATTAGRHPAGGGVVLRRKGQQSQTAIVIAAAIRARSNQGGGQ